MPTNEERRKVAARLRMIASHKEADEELAHDMLGRFDTYGVMELADLIEPEPERTCKAEQDYDAMDDGIPDCRIWKCSCGESFPYWRGCFPEYCPNCGAKVVE